MMKVRGSVTTASALVFCHQQVRGLVSLHGQTQVATDFARRKQQQQQQRQHRLSERTHMLIGEKPPVDPTTLLVSEQALREQASKLVDWWDNTKANGKNILCLTGAGLSTESGIPDYRGHRGSYHTGHKPMIHDQFMRSESARKRYWGRGMVGWRFFHQKEPSSGHLALQQLERMGKLGVSYEDHPQHYRDESHFLTSSGQRQLSVITQNVDTLHRRAGTRHLIELHGRTDRLVCMQCGSVRGRASFHNELESLNTDWLNAALAASQASDMRADGDAHVAASQSDYDLVNIPSCRSCGGFLKPDVVFFGDSVPVHRVRQCEAAVEACGGLLVVGSSLAVHSAFRHVRAANKNGIPICILNVGETRAEAEGLTGLLKIEAPAGPVLAAVAELFSQGNTVQT